MTNDSRLEQIVHELIHGEVPMHRTAAERCSRRILKLFPTGRPFPWLSVLVVIVSATLVVNLLAIVRAFTLFADLITALQTVGKCIQ